MRLERRRLPLFPSLPAGRRDDSAADSRAGTGGGDPHVVQKMFSFICPLKAWPQVQNTLVALF